MSLKSRILPSNNPASVGRIYGRSYYLQEELTDEGNTKNVSVKKDDLIFKNIDTYRIDKHKLTSFFSRSLSIISLDKRLKKIFSELQYSTKFIYNLLKIKTRHSST